MSECDQPEDDDRVRYDGIFGKYSLPGKLFGRLIPAISKWIVPAAGISIGIYFGCEGVAKIIAAFIGVAE